VFYVNYERTDVLVNIMLSRREAQCWL